LITSALMLAGAATAAADPGPGVPPGPGFCLGPPGQSGLVDFAKEFDMPPGQIVSLCNGHGHGQNQAGGGGVS
jgi:hypothetical protein